MAEEQWWYCLSHERVEGNDGCMNAVRLGPFPSKEEAANALQHAAERTKKWDEEDREWEEGPDGPD